jgi:hypothetical protein
MACGLTNFEFRLADMTALKQDRQRRDQRHLCHRQ